MNQSILDLRSNGVLVDHALAIACSEQPQQRLETFGANALSDTELVAVILQGNGITPTEALAIGSRLIAEAGSIAGLISWQPSDFRRLKHIGRAKGRQLSAVAEIGRRMIMGPAQPAVQLNRADLIATYFAPIAAGLPVEKFWVLCLNRKNRLIKRIEVTSGTATAALAHPREVFRAAVQHTAAAIVCVHNHPSGDPAPSTADIHVTRQLREAARTLDIELLDHVIIGRPESDPIGVGHYSFRSAGLL